MSAKTFAIRASVSGAAVVSLALYNWLGFEPLRWLGLALYVVCLAMFLLLLLTRRERR